MRKCYMIGVMLPFLLTGSACDANYDRAVAAYKRGEYMLAVKEFFSFFRNKDLDTEYQQWKIKIEAMGLPENYEDVVPWLEKKANEGSAEAQYHLGVMYRDGLGVIKNPTLAQEWLKKAAEQGLSPAQYDLGMMYYSGNSIPRNYTSALDFMKKSALQGNGNAMMYMGKMYGEGLGVSPDISVAYAWLTLAESYITDGATKAVLEQSMGSLFGQMSKDQLKIAENMILTLRNTMPR